MEETSCKIELAAKMTASGKQEATGSEYEYNLIFEKGVVADYAFNKFKDYVFANVYYDAWDNPIESGGISVEASDTEGRFWKGRVRYSAVKSSGGSSGSGGDVGGSGGSSGSTTPNFSAQSFSTTGTTSRQYVFNAYNYDAYGGSLGQSVAFNEDGIDYVAPTLSIELERKFPQQALGPMAYRIAQATGKLNLNKFQGFAPGTVLFVGCSSGSLQYQEETSSSGPYFYWKCVYQFLFSPHIEIPTLGGPILKCGFDAYWTSYEVVNGSIELVHHVAPVYDVCDFSILGVN